MRTNEVKLIGKIRKHSIVNQFAATNVAKVFIATKEKVPQFFMITCFNDLTVLASELLIDDEVEIYGSLKNNSWVDKKTQEKKYSLDIVANVIKRLNQLPQDQSNDAPFPDDEIPF